MAVEIPVVTFTRNGNPMPTPVTGDVDQGHRMPNDGRTGLIVKNADVELAHAVTINLVRTVDGQAVVPRTVSVPASTSVALGPFNPGDYGGDVSIGVDSTSLSLLAVRVA
ncbi:hypothetical protein [Streptomyces fumanus]|uniref:hypothetical protein n=1 Tax=Streptomyces fumanus TaxID=67302 RepID=UPI0033D4A5CE